MTELVLIDTDILIDTAYGVDKAVSYMKALEKQYQLAISLITQMELIVGCRNKHDLLALNKFLNRFEIIKINESISTIAIHLFYQYRLSHGVMMPDTLIAATALHYRCAFASKNQRDYRFIDNLNLLPY